MLVGGESLGDRIIAAVGHFGRNQKVVLGEAQWSKNSFPSLHRSLGSSLGTALGRDTKLGCNLAAACLSSMPKLWVQSSVSPGEGGGGGKMGVGVMEVGEVHLTMGQVWQRKQ